MPTSQISPETKVSYRIRRATSADVPAILGLRREAEHWLAQRGFTQWTERWATVANEKAERAARQQRAWVVENSAAIAATVTLGGPDEDLWRPEDGPALYMYKLIVARAHAGAGLGEEIMRWCSNFAASYGYSWLRLDCWPANQSLISYYQRHGWVHIRTVSVPGRDTGTLMERPAERHGTTLLTLA